MKGYKAWVEIAREDLESAKVLYREEIYGVALYHSHQCAEKILKGYLAFKKQTIPRTHDIVGLIEVCSQWEKSFLNMLSQAEYLNPFATQFRYPTDKTTPSGSVVKNAIAQSEEIFQLVLKKIYPS